MGETGVRLVSFSQSPGDTTNSSFFLEAIGALFAKLHDIANLTG